MICILLLISLAISIADYFLIRHTIVHDIYSSYDGISIMATVLPVLNVLMLLVVSIMIMTEKLNISGAVDFFLIGRKDNK